MFERVFQWMLEIRSPLLASLVGAPNLAYSASFDPAETQTAVDRIEVQVFGKGGLSASESEWGVDSLQVLARRSYAQYLGREAALRYPWVRHVHGVIHAFALTLLLPALLALGARRRPPGEGARVVVVGGTAGSRNVFESHRVGGSAVFCEGPGEGFGKEEARFFLRSVAAFPSILLSPPLLTNLLRWLSKYGWIRRQHRPAELVAFAEGIPACSLLTGYLREFGIRHVNHMHGERFSTPAQAFCCFDEFVVWGDVFRELFLSQRWRAPTIRVGGTPHHVRLFREVRYAAQRPRTITVMHTQFLAVGTIPFANLALVMAELASDWRVEFRPHYKQLDAGREAFESLTERFPRMDLTWQDPSKVSLVESISRTAVAVGAQSTALLESWVAGRKVIHLPGEMSPEAFMGRYSGSPNVLFASDPAMVAEFLATPAVDDDAERIRVNRLVRMDPARILEDR